MMVFSYQKSLQSILEHDPGNLPKAQKFVFRGLQIACASLRDLADGHLSLRAMSLVYTTLITLVPLLAISFSVLKGFGVHNQIEPLLLNVLEGLGPEKSQEVAERVIGFVDNIKVGVLGAVGLALLLYAVIALMQKIETAFNYIWRVGQSRTFAQRFSNYLSVLLMGPLLIFISAGITAAIRNLPFFQHAPEISSLGPVLEVFGILVPWFVMALGFTFIYIYMPNTKVRIQAAFSGALVAALLWKIMGYIFASFIAESANYVAIYAAFATLIVLMIWLYASWLVVLIGANVAFYVQYPRYLRISRETLVLSPQMRMTLGLCVLSLITQAHYRDRPAYGIDSLSKELNVPVLAVQKILEVLESGGILIASDKTEPVLYYPARPFGKTPLLFAIEVLQTQGQAGWNYHDGRMRIPNQVAKAMNVINDAQRQALAGVTIAQALGADPEDGKTP